ncbi:MAG: response regulator [Bacteroidia bacterium]
MINVLLIEDHPDIRENTTEILELAGYNVYVAQNGIVGINMAKEKLPDIILCDILMPEADGWEVIKQLKANEATAEIPFVFITASVEKKEILAGLEMGADSYIPKPFELKELLDTVEACLLKNKTF